MMGRLIGLHLKMAVKDTRNISLFLILTYLVTYTMTSDEFSINSLISDEDDVIRDLLRNVSTPNLSAQKTYVRIRSDINHRFARTTITERAVNSPDSRGHLSPMADSANTRTATFETCIPLRAVITNVSLSVNGRNFNSHITRRNSKLFRARFSNSTANVHRQLKRLKLTQCNYFHLSVDLAPGGEAELNLTYEELLKRELGRYTHRISLISRQLVPQMRVDVRIKESEDIENLLVLPLKPSKHNTRGNDTFSETSDIRVKTSSPHSAHVTYSPSPAHQRRIWTSGQGLGVQLSVQYDVKRRLDAGHIHSMDDYFVHYFAPTGIEPMGKNCLFLIDVSRSMPESLLSYVTKSLANVINTLRHDDLLNVVAYSTNFKFLFRDGLIPVSVNRVREAKDFLFSLKPSSGAGSNLNDALLRGLDMLIKQEESEPLTTRYSTLILITDGKPSVGITEPDRILSNVRQANAGRVSVHVLTPNTEHHQRLFYDVLAQQNRGQSIHIGNSNDPGYNPVSRSRATRNTDDIESSNWVGKLNVKNRLEVNETINQVSGSRDRKRSMELSNKASRSREKKSTIRSSNQVNRLNDEKPTKIRSSNDQRGTLETFFQSISSPLLKSVRVRYEDSVEDRFLTDSDFPVYTEGSEVVVAGQLKRGSSQVAVKVLGLSAKGFMTLDLRVRTGRSDRDDYGRRSRSRSGVEFSRGAWLHLMIDKLRQRSLDSFNMTLKREAEASASQLSIQHSMLTAWTCLEFDAPKELALLPICPDPATGRYLPSLSSKQRWTDRPSNTSNSLPHPQHTHRSFVDNDPHFLISMDGMQDAVCFDVDTIPGSIIQLLHDKNKDLTVNSLIVRERTINSTISDGAAGRTYLGIISILHSHHSIRIDPLRLTVDDVTVDWMFNRTIFISSNVTVHLVARKHATIQIGEGIQLRVLRHVASKKNPTRVNFLGFYILDGSQLSEYCHGLIGQFVHQSAHVNPSSISLRTSQHHVRLRARLSVSGPHVPHRSVYASLSRRRDMDLHKHIPCWHVANNAAGLIKGHPEQYLVSHLQYRTSSFRYSHVKYPLDSR